MRLHGGVQAAEIEAVVDPAKGLRREPQREAARHHSRPWQQWHAAEARPSSEQPHQPLRRSHERDDARYGGRTRGPERCSLAEAAHGASGAFQRAIGPGEYVLDIDEQLGQKRTSSLINLGFSGVSCKKDARVGTLGGPVHRPRVLAEPRHARDFMDAARRKCIFSTPRLGGAA